MNTSTHILNGGSTVINLNFSFDRAVEHWLSGIESLGFETVLLDETLGRILATDLYSDIDVSPFDNSAMDGFALRHADLSKASAQNPVELKILGCVAAGQYWDGPVESGQAVRIMTGAPLPAGTGSVVKVEDSVELTRDGAPYVRLVSPVPRGLNVRYKGEEIKVGQRVLAAGERICPAAIGLLAATGYAQVPVYRQPVVAIISTGEELISVSETPTQGKIRNTNSHSLAAQARSAGAKVRQYASIPDTLEDTIACFKQAASECDLIVSSGGVSVGDFDFVEEAVRSLGELHISAVRMRPGKPQTTGTIEGIPFFGLPGNPASAYLGFELFVRPAILKMMGHTQLKRPVQKARLAHDIKKRPGLRYFMRGIIDSAETQDPGKFSAGTDAEAQRYSVRLSGDQSSALLGSLRASNCLIVLPEEEEYVQAGSVLTCIRLDIEEAVGL
jgi:molybdopterin molybdotransferase